MFKIILKHIIKEKINLIILIKSFKIKIEYNKYI